MSEEELSRRERQIMDIVHARGEADAREVWRNLEPQPVYATVRKLLTILEEKGKLAKRKDGRKFIYRPTESSEVVGRSLLRRALDVFYGGSLEKAAVGLFSAKELPKDPEVLDRLQEMIDEARKSEPEA